ncbi:hypothetical protein ABIE09_004485 [Lysobacter enzymogenes]|uniref:hypothetical protein n=1 Tax=Lysobacter enzymogenes TaxID=69 RepID=UPI00339638FF
MSRRKLPDLTFPMIAYGSIEQPDDLQRFMFMGGAKIKRSLAKSIIESGSLGPPIMKRLPLIAKLHEVLTNRIVAGGSKHTLRNQIYKISLLYTYLDSRLQHPTLESVADDFSSWIAHQKGRVLQGKTTEKTVYENGYKLATVLGETINTGSRFLMRNCGLKKPARSKKALGTEADKQNLAETMSLGPALLALSDQLDNERIFGEQPLALRFPNGRTLPLSHRPYKTKRKSIHPKFHPEERSPLCNLRIKSELLIFISQTGMNLAQATSITIGNFIYKSHLNGYQVRRLYKNRARGDVEFEIFSEYRKHFEHYLKWRNSIFPTTKHARLFPFVAAPGKTVQYVSPFKSLINVIRAAGYKYVGPKKLRSTRVNWLLRRSQDPGITAEMSQHTQRTLLTSYQKPHHQLAVAEVTKFWNRTDPSLMSAGPGQCSGTTPERAPGAPTGVPEPDCYGASGCLFCVHHRDIDTEDYVWSLTTLRYLKSLEEARKKPLRLKEQPRTTSASLVIERLTAKLKEFEESSPVRSNWVSEAIAKVAEEEYHPRWAGFVVAAEILQ